MAKLHILSGVLEGKAFDLLADRVTLGRGLDNIIRLEDGTVSHHHAMVLQEGGEYKLRDLNSTNGTRVNGLRIVETKIHNGDQVRLGSVEMRFEADIKKASQPLPPSQTGVDLTEVGMGGKPPETFSSVSPFRKKRTADLGAYVWILVALGLLALAGLAWLFYSFFLK